MPRITQPMWCGSFLAAICVASAIGWHFDLDPAGFESPPLRAEAPVEARVHAVAFEARPTERSDAVPRDGDTRKAVSLFHESWDAVDDPSNPVMFAMAIDSEFDRDVTPLTVAYEPAAEPARPSDMMPPAVRALQRTAKPPQRRRHKTDAQVAVFRNASRMSIRPSTTTWTPSPAAWHPVLPSVYEAP